MLVCGVRYVMIADNLAAKRTLAIVRRLLLGIFLMAKGSRATVP
jgi:hypothetical protein